MFIPPDLPGIEAPRSKLRGMRSLFRSKKQRPGFMMTVAIDSFRKTVKAFSGLSGAERVCS